MVVSQHGIQVPKCAVIKRVANVASWLNPDVLRGRPERPVFP
jgi:hypothetical protein